MTICVSSIMNTVGLLRMPALFIIALMSSRQSAMP